MTLLLLATLLVGAPPSGDAASKAAGKARLLASIDEKMNALEYDQAREACLIALDRDDLSPQERVSVHMQAGVAQRVLDRSMESRMHFEQALKIDPNATLPAKTSPKIRTFFRMIKDEAKDAGAMAAPPSPPVTTPQPSGSDVPADEHVPWAAYSVVAVGAVLAAVVMPVLLGTAAVIYFMVLPQPIDPSTKSLFRYGFFGAVATGGGALVAGGLCAGLGGALLWLE